MRINDSLGPARRARCVIDVCHRTQCDSNSGIVSARTRERGWVQHIDAARRFVQITQEQARGPTLR